jgi:excisionase family DNA binding protein
VHEPLSLRERLRRIIEPLPPGSSVTLPREALAAMIGEAEPRPLADYRVVDVAGALNRAPSTVRGWCQTGELRAYRFQGKEWRITREALREFQDRQASGVDQDGGDDDLASWREVS